MMQGELQYTNPDGSQVVKGADGQLYQVPATAVVIFGITSLTFDEANPGCVVLPSGDLG